MNPAEKIQQLIEYLNFHTRLYDEGKPIISDLDWDKKYFELQELENKYSIYFNNSPTQTISYEVVNSLEKVAHNHDMLSLEKTKALNEIKDFLGNEPYLAMCKMDGLTCSLKYENGFLVSAETRGNGKVGENILHNAKIIPSIPKQIPITHTLVIDGEIICSKADFKEFENEYANPRNFASGSIRLLDSNECSKRKLQFIAWDVIEGLEDERDLSSKLDMLELCGFTPVPYYRGDDKEEVGIAIDALTRSADILFYPIDGIVFKFENVAYGRSLGQTSHHFKNAMAFKFADDLYETELINIDYEVSRNGEMVPVAIFKPVEIDGAIIQRCSLFNLSILEEKLGHPYVNQKIWVCKKNMIIPYIEKAIKTNQ